MPNIPITPNDADRIISEMKLEFDRVRREEREEKLREMRNNKLREG